MTNTTIKVSRVTLAALNDIRNDLLPKLNAQADEIEQRHPGMKVHRGITHDQLIRDMIDLRCVTLSLPKPNWADD